MSALFKKPSIPKPEPAAPIPSVDDARARVDIQERRRRQRGQSATRMVEEESSVSTAAKALTGN